MRHPSSSRARRSTGAVLVVLGILLVAGLVAHGQGGQSPLSRGTSTIEGRSPSEFLQASATFVDGNDAIQLSLRYACVTAAGGSDNDCRPGRIEGTVDLPNTPRLVDVYWALNGTNPSVTSTNTTTLTSSGLSGSSTLFTGTIPLTAIQAPLLTEGGLIRFLVKVRLTNSDICGTPCDRLDPPDTTGQLYYQARMDRTSPVITVNPISGAFADKVADNQWYIYTPPSFNPPKPIVITMVDNQSGAPIDQARTSIYFNGVEAANNVTSQFTRTAVTPTSVAYTWHPADPSTGSINFPAGQTSVFHVDTRDSVGHRLDTRSTPNTPAVRVVIDAAPPKLDNKTSGLGLALGQTGLASKGELLRVSINATDFNTANNNFATPKDLMRVCATLVPATEEIYKNLTAAQLAEDAKKCQEAPDADPSDAANVTKGQYLRIPFVPQSTRASCGAAGCFFSDAFVVPKDWDYNGLVTARIVAVDPVGQSHFGHTWGKVFGLTASKKSSNLTVDLLAPVIVQKEPLSGTTTTDFVATEQIKFRARVTDPGDTDPWEGENTEKNDKDLLGIDQGSVKVRYSIDGGNQVGVTLKAIPEENHFASNPLTLAEEDTLTYFFEAKDLSGNPTRLPASGEYTIRVDRKGPTVAEAKFHEFLNGEDHVLKFTIEDGGIGLDATKTNLFWRTPGTQYKTLVMTSVDGKTFTATIPGQPDGTVIEWYAEARDLFGNIGTFPVSNPTAAPSRSTVDTLAPKTTITAPDRVTDARFSISWGATDGAGSGADTYTIQFRVGEGGKWYSLVTDSTATTFQMCADAQKTYHFRGSATDRAGNVEAFPETPQTQTFVAATEACADPPQVTISAPRAGDKVSGDYTIRWSATSQVAPDGLEYTIDLVKAGAAALSLTTITDAATDSFVWKTASLDPDDPCFEVGTYDLKVTARDPNSKTGVGEITGILLENGIKDCTDRDADGLIDSWEVVNFKDLAQTPQGDFDQDGHSNVAEFAAASDPTDPQSVPDSVKAPGDDEDGTGWNDLYLLVVMGFLATLVVFVVGVSRRW